MKLSVLLTTYNCENYLYAAVSSILNQTFSEFEFIIVDDGSDDNTERVVKNIADERIKYYKIEHVGRSKALNYGLTKCNSDWVALMDGDDIAHPLRFEIQLNTINENPELDMVSSWYGIFNENNLLYINKTPVDDTSIKKSLMLHSVISNPGVVFRKEAVMDVEGYDFLHEDYWPEDYSLWLRLIDKAIFYNIPKALIFQRYRTGSVSRKNLQLTQERIYQLQEPYINDYIENKSPKEKYRLLGWREYFYGRKSRVLRYWMKLNFQLVLEIKILFGIITLLLPERYFIEFKESRLRFRLGYLLTYFTKINKENRKIFNRIIQNKN
ncbi:MAG TPA: glycosyltransferase [Ignavibacteriaceae bacterium]|nr:glycosyltransferase [Ignavibacteriaceae bacterium]